MRTLSAPNAVGLDTFQPPPSVLSDHTGRIISEQSDPGIADTLVLVPRRLAFTLGRYATLNRSLRSVGKRQRGQLGR